MGVTVYPCPSCGQAQRQEHPNGEGVKLGPCAACSEHLRQEVEEILRSDQSKKNKELALALTFKRYGAPIEEAEGAARLAVAQG